MYSLGKERVLARLGGVGVIGYASGVFGPAALHLPAPPFPRNEGLLGQIPTPHYSGSRSGRTCPHSSSERSDRFFSNT